MTPGDFLSTEVWLTGLEKPGDITAWKRSAEDDFYAAGRSAKMDIGQVVWQELQPDDEACPPVPRGKKYEGPNQRLLLGAAQVLRRTRPASWFTLDLEPDDLRRLRDITRKAYQKALPLYPTLTDSQCDTIINDLGPEAAEVALYRGGAEEPVKKLLLN